MSNFKSFALPLAVFAASLLPLLLTGGCTAHKSEAGSFGSDVAFLQQHGNVVLLSDRAGKAKVAIAPGLQARVMTSTATGDAGSSFGWINRTYFTDSAAGKTNPHISPWGGEDRFWIGPEGGQFGIFFAKGMPFDLEHWFTPRWIDTEPFETVLTSKTQASFRRDVAFSNYSGTPFNVRIDRTVRLLDDDAAWDVLHMKVAPPHLKVVAFETQSSITNTGSADWSKKTGLLSVWILGMFNATPTTTVVIPVAPGDGPAVNDDYFGKVPPDRLKTIGNTVYFKADANFRSKIGIPPVRAKNILGSYDPQHQVLTFIQFTLDESAHDYVNSAWKLQNNPFGGDVINSYNDGPPGGGNPQLGQFYELESSSPARELKRGESLRHTVWTMHFQGSEESLDELARAKLGVGLDEIRNAFQ